MSEKGEKTAKNVPEQLRPWLFRQGNRSATASATKRNIASAVAKELWCIPIPETLRRALQSQGRIDPATGKPRKGRPRKDGLDIPRDASFGEALVYSLFVRAIKGDTFAAKLAVTLVQGLPSRDVTVSGGLAHLHADMDTSVLEQRLLSMMGEKPALLLNATPEPPK